MLFLLQVLRVLELLIRGIFCILQNHEEATPDHKLMTIEEYIEQTQLASSRYCTYHSSEELTHGCKVCSELFCSKCTGDISSCRAGEQLIRCSVIIVLVPQLHSYDVVTIASCIMY